MNIKPLFKPIFVLICLCTFLTGCLYPNRDTTTTKVVSKEAIRNVQGAVSDYYNDKGIYPVTATTNTQFQNLKLRVDFQKLMEENYIDTIPTSAFEKSGIFYFVIYEYDDLALVKAFDIQASQMLSTYQEIVYDYIFKHYSLPATTEISPNFYELDYELLKSKVPSIISPFTAQPLTLMVSSTGQVYFNYTLDIMNYVQQYGNEDSYADLAEILIINSDYVPIKSPKYKFEAQMPVPYEEE